MHNTNTNIYLFIHSLAGRGAEKLNILLLNTIFDIKSILLIENKIDYAIDKNRVECITSYRSKLPSWLLYLLVPFSAYKLCTKVKKNDIIIASLFRQIIIALFCKFLFKNIKVVAWLHNELGSSLPAVFSFKQKRLICAYLYSKCDFIIGNSKKICEELLSSNIIPHSNINTIYNGFDCNQIIESSKEDIEEEYKHLFYSPTILCIGNLRLLKGQHFLIEVIKKIKETIPNVKLLLIGVGDGENFFKKKVEEYSLQENVIFLGFQSNPYKFISRSQIIASASLTEGFGNILVEAMIIGAKIFSTDINNGPREILAPDTNIYKRLKVNYECAMYGYLLPSFDMNTDNLNTVNTWADILIKELYKSINNNDQMKNDAFNKFDISNIKIFWSVVLNKLV